MKKYSGILAVGILDSEEAICKVDFEPEKAVKLFNRLVFFKFYSNVQFYYSFGDKENYKRVTIVDYSKQEVKASIDVTKDGESLTLRVIAAQNALYIVSERYSLNTNAATMLNDLCYAMLDYDTVVLLSDDYNIASELFTTVEECIRIVQASAGNIGAVSKVSIPITPLFR